MMRVMRALAALVVTLTMLGAGSRTLAARPATAAAASCSPSSPGISGSAGSLPLSINDFGFRLFNRLNPDSGRNVVISPASIHLALDMAYAGARGATARAMAKALGLNGSAGQTDREAAVLLTSLAGADPKAKLEVANSLWVRAGVPLQSAYRQEVTRMYAARATDLDFSAPNAPDTINAWVSCATHGAIPTIIQKIPAQMILYLLNAVYFKADWAMPFSPARTQTQAFTTPSATVMVPMMKSEGTYPYLAANDFQAISLPYGSGRFALTAVLPRSGVSLSSLAGSLSAGGWQNWMKAMKPAYGTLAIPRFTTTTGTTLNAPLGQLGMSLAFDRHADFTGMCTRPCRISDVKHKTYLRLDESGTTAAAVTSVGVSITAVQVPQFQLSFDHPFLLTIRDTQTGTLLFLGAINNPLR